MAINLLGFFRKPFLFALNALEHEEIVNYRKIVDDRFIEVPEKGFYLQTETGAEIISQARVFVERTGEFWSFSTDYDVGELYGESIGHFEERFGGADSITPAIEMRNTFKTLPTRRYNFDDLRISVSTKDGRGVSHIHIKTP